MFKKKLDKIVNLKNLRQLALEIKKDEFNYDNILDKLNKIYNDNHIEYFNWNHNLCLFLLIFLIIYFILMR